MLFPLCIIFEDIKAILRFKLIIQTNPMSDLILFLYQIKLFLNSWVVLVFVFSYLKQDLDHVLHPLINIGLV